MIKAAKKQEPERQYMSLYLTPAQKDALTRAFMLKKREGIHPVEDTVYEACMALIEKLEEV